MITVYLFMMVIIGRLLLGFLINQLEKVVGTVEPPTNGILLEKMIYDLTKYEEDPWLF